MTIEEFTQQNIDKVTVTPLLNGRRYLIQAKDGYCILIPENITTDEDGNVHRLFKYAVGLQSTYDWSTIEIHTTDSLGAGDEIAGVNPPTEIA